MTTESTMTRGAGTSMLLALGMTSLLLACGGISERELQSRTEKPTEPNAVESSPTPENTVPEAIESPPTADDVAAATRAATIAYVSDAGRFNVVARVRIVPDAAGVPVMDLAVSGEKQDSSMTMGMNLALSSDQAGALFRGEAVAVNTDSGLGYGLPTGQVIRRIDSMKLERAGAEMWSLKLQFSGDAQRTDEAPKSLGTSTEAVFVGELGVECLAPGPAGREQFVREDTSGQSEFCSKAIERFGLAPLMK